MRYPIVLLDAGDTLIGPRRSYGAVYAEVLGELGLDLDGARLERSIRVVSAELQRAVPAGADRFSRFGGEEGYWSRFLRDVLREVSAEADPGFVGRALPQLRERFARPAAWTVPPDVVPALEALRAAGHRLAVVSNWDSRLPRLLQRLGLGGYFEVVTVSALEGTEKPAPELFRRALARLGAQPAQSLHVGDSPEHDVAGARAAGIAALLLDRSGATAGTLTDLRDLPALA